MENEAIMELQSKRIIVTGSARGMGAATVRAYVRAGADVIDMNMGNPMDAPPDVVVDKLREAVTDPRNRTDGVSIKKSVEKSPIGARNFAWVEARKSSPNTLIACAAKF